MHRTNAPRHSRQAPSALVAAVFLSLSVIGLSEQRLWAMDTRMPEVSWGQAAPPEADPPSPVIWADEYPPPPDKQVTDPPAEAAPQRLPHREDRASSPLRELIGSARTPGPPGRGHG